MNIRAMKTQEDVASLMAGLAETQRSVEGYATILSCLVEFNSIE